MFFFPPSFPWNSPRKHRKTMGRSVAEASLGMAPAFAILASNDAAARVASKNSASAGVQLFQPLGTRYGTVLGPPWVMAYLTTVMICYNYVVIHIVDLMWLDYVHKMMKVLVTFVQIHLQAMACLCSDYAVIHATFADLDMDQTKDSSGWFCLAEEDSGPTERERQRESIIYSSIRNGMVPHP